MCLSGETPAQGSAHGVRRRDRPICVPTWSALILPLELCRPTSSFRAMPYQGSRRAGRRAGAYMRSVARHGTSKWCRLCSSGTGGSRTTSDFCAAHSVNAPRAQTPPNGVPNAASSAHGDTSVRRVQSCHTGPLESLVRGAQLILHPTALALQPTQHGAARRRSEGLRGGASTRCPQSAQQR